MNCIFIWLMENVLFISVFNYGCIEIAENHIFSLLRNGIDNYMAYATDEIAYNKLKEKGYHVTYYAIDHTCSEKMDFGTNNFNDLSYIRYKIIGELLNQNYTVWYLDVDTVVLYDLNKLVSGLIGNDIVMQNDINMPCSGCMLFFPNSKTHSIVNYIYDSRTSNENDQIIFSRFLFQNKEMIALKLLDIDKFPNGLLYFSEWSNHPTYREMQKTFRDKQGISDVYFVHANWMVGIDTKINAFKSKNLWYLK